MLEITESATADDPEAAIAQLQTCAPWASSCRSTTSGPGYSSLSYLRRYPVQHLKVDRSFVAEVVTNPEDHAIVSAIINLAHSLGLRVIGEGVETVEQLDELRRMGCDQAQGFLWRVPAGEVDVTNWLSSLRPWSAGNAGRRTVTPLVRSNEVQGRVADDLRGAGRSLRRAGQGALERRADLLRHQ